MIVGTGLDIVDVERVQRIYDRYGEMFAQRILCEVEMVGFLKATFPARFLAKRFAAKEAVVKALGTGFSGGISFDMVCVSHDKHGRPLVVLTKAARKRADALQSDVSWISISDEKYYAAAFVVLEKTS